MFHPLGLSTGRRGDALVDLRDEPQATKPALRKLPQPGRKVDRFPRPPNAIPVSARGSGLHAC